jgi:hypothetical protein
MHESMQSLNRLFGSPARVKMLRLFVFNQDMSFSIEEVAERTKLSKDISRREIKDLLKAGLLKKKGEGARTRYQANSRYEHLEALDAFVRGTTAVRPEVILSEVKRAGAPRLVVLSGMFSGIMEPQVDLLVVGDNIEERTLARVVRSLEAELGREIRYASFATADFRYRRGVYDRLLRDVFDYPHRILIDKIGL